MSTVFPHDHFVLATDYRILHEDGWLLAVDKPAPLPTHPVGRFREWNLVSLLLKEPRFAGGALYPVNRLDSETSGVVLLARSKQDAGFLGRQFMARRVRKLYHAVTVGHPAEDSGMIEIPLGKDRSTHIHSIRVRDEAGEKASTRYRVIEKRGGCALVALEPLTGRTHQLRAHLALCGHPVAGDKQYIDPEIYTRYIRGGWSEDMRAVVKLERLALHASEIEIVHPESGRPVTFRSPLPPLLREFFERQGEPCIS